LLTDEILEESNRSACRNVLLSYILPTFTRIWSIYYDISAYLLSSGYLAVFSYENITKSLIALEQTSLLASATSNGITKEPCF
jgi:hypothetical protein